MTQLSQVVILDSTESVCPVCFKKILSLKSAVPEKKSIGDQVVDIGMVVANPLT